MCRMCGWSLPYSSPLQFYFCSELDACHLGIFPLFSGAAGATLRPAERWTSAAREMKQQRRTTAERNTWKEGCVRGALRRALRKLFKTSVLKQEVPPTPAETFHSARGLKLYRGVVAATVCENSFD